jgi:ketosteroid isomerase-like protein
MPEENVEIILESLRRFEAEDFDAIRDLWHVDGRITSPEGWPEAGPFEGRDAVLNQLRRLASDMGEHRFRDVEVLADRDGWVVLSFVWEVRGGGSGAAVASKLAGAYHLQDGKVVESHFRWTAEDALEAAGLSE